MLRERANYYYKVLGHHCSDGMLMAGNEYYHLGLSDEAMAPFAGFAKGMGCGSTCGALSGAIGILSILYKDREDLKPLCAAFVDMYRQRFATIDCEPIEAKYKTEENRCTAAVEIAADLLEAYINQLEGKATDLAEDAAISPEDIKRVKGLGFLQHKKTNKFNARVITRNGRVTAAEAQAIAEAAEKFGDGHMMYTTRLTVEISGIEYQNIDACIELLAKAGLSIGGTGSKVRPVVSCKGTTCQYGNYDTYKMSDEIHRRFYLGYRDVALPHKFKIATGGCPNNCVKPSLNDVGITGVRIPQYNADLCRGCKKCQIETACPIHAASMIDGKLVINKDACNNCGRCVGKCLFHCADEGINGWTISIGGRWGKKIAIGQTLNKVFTSEEDVYDTIEKVILFFRSEGISGERLADTVARLGFEKSEAMILGNELLERKAEILGLNVVGGASC